jgi:hypothetical protein
MQITVEVSRELASALRAGAPPSAPASAAARALVAAARSFGLSLQPLHSGAAASGLESFFYIDVPSSRRHQAREIVEMLAACDGVEGAYIKPPEGPPS